MNKKLKFSMMVLNVLIVITSACSGPGDYNKKTAGDDQHGLASGNANEPADNKGIGPIKSITLGAIDLAIADEGQKIYQAKCSACHKPEEKFVGPAPKGIMDRRTPEWIMNMILNPEEMIKSDPIAKQLLIDFNFAPMANQHLTQDEARKILEYFRTLK
jgi:cytochrome c